MAISLATTVIRLFITCTITSKRKTYTVHNLCVSCTVKEFFPEKLQVEGFWLAYKGLPIEQQEWEASKKLKMEIDQYMEILPLLQQLHSREIRNRHWLQVMGVANCTFQLEGSIFKMAHLLDAGLLL